MHIEYSETEAFFGDYQRVTYTLTNGSPNKIYTNCLEKSKENDIIMFESSLLNGSVFCLRVNESTDYIPWEHLWSLYANIDERIGIIRHFGFCELLLKGKPAISLNNIEPEDFLEITKGKRFIISPKFKGYRLNYPNTLMCNSIKEEEIFKYIEKKIYHKEYRQVKGLTVRGICFNIVEI